jgi:hypothetical protein
MVWVDRACAAVLTQKFAAGLFDGALPDPSKHVQLNSAEHRVLARQTATEGAVLLRNPNKTLPLDIAKVKKLAIIGPNAGCENDGLPHSPPPPPGQCDVTQGIDCPGDDIQKVNNVSDTGECCKLCLANKDCVTAVLAVGALPGGLSQCLMKSSCDAPTTMPVRGPSKHVTASFILAQVKRCLRAIILRWQARVVIQTGRKAQGSSTDGQTPWSCLAQRAMLGGYSNLEQQTDVRLFISDCRCVFALPCCRLHAMLAFGRILYLLVARVYADGVSILLAGPPGQPRACCDGLGGGTSYSECLERCS